jgi:hypothetical protein
MSGGSGPVDGSDGNILRAALGDDQGDGPQEDPPALADYDRLPEEQGDPPVLLDEAGRAGAAPADQAWGGDEYPFEDPSPS